MQRCSGGAPVVLRWCSAGAPVVLRWWSGGLRWCSLEDREVVKDWWTLREGGQEGEHAAHEEWTPWGEEHREHTRIDSLMIDSCYDSR